MRRKDCANRLEFFNKVIKHVKLIWLLKLIIYQFIENKILIEDIKKI